MKHLYYCRHGESTYNLKGIYAGQTDVPLTALGREQARVAGLDAIDLRIDAIVTSPLIRALETARIVADNAGFDLDKIITDPLFMERSLGSLEGQTYDFGHEDDESNGTIEPMETLMRRAAEGLELLRSLEAENILLVSHGSFGKALQTVLNPDRDYGEPPNAQIIKLL